MNLNFDHLLELCPSDVRKRMECLKNVQQRSDHHPEGNVFNHTRIVVNRLAKYNNVILSWAGVFHDIGKDVTTKMGDDGILHSLGHEDVSATDVIKPFGIATSFIAEGLTGNCNENLPLIRDWEKIAEICQFHMRMKLFDEMKLSKKMKMRCLPTFGLLQLFTVADNMHTLTEKELTKSSDEK